MKWVMKNGSKIDIEDISTEHIRNCIKMLDKQGTYTTYIGEVDIQDIDYIEECASSLPEYKALKVELERRIYKNIGGK